MTNSPKNTAPLTLINIGFGNTISLSRLTVIASPDAAPTKRLISEAREGGRLIDATYGRRTRSIVMMDSGHIVLSALQPEALAKRVATEGESRG